MATAVVTEEGISAEEWAIRVDLAAAYRLVALYGWDDLIFTHLSARIPGPDHHFLINPYTLMFDEMTASALVKIDVEGKPVGTNRGPVNPAGFTIHSALHMARDDAQAVMHLHTPAGQAVSAMRFGLLPQIQTSMAVTHDLAYHDYEGIATDLAERERLVADLGSRHSMILRNHGTLTVGDSIASCFLRLYVLERGCEAQVLMLGAGREQLVDPDPEIVARVAEQSRAERIGGIADVAWAALLRKLDRVNPGYRD